MHVNPDSDPFTSEWADQSASEKLKAWMRNAGWSISFSADPADILEFVQEHGDDCDFDNFSIQLDI